MSKLGNARDRRHTLLAEVVDVVGDVLMRKHGLPVEDAAVVGNAVADHLRDTWGGQSIYFVRDEAFEMTRRNWEIFEKMKRGNAQELAKEYGLSFVQVYAIYRRCLEEVRKHREPGLFEALDADADRTDASS